MALEQTYLSGAETDELNLVTFTKELYMQGVTASTAAGSYAETSLTRPVWTADAPSILLAVYERHSVLGSTNIQLVVAHGSTPLGSGTPVLSTPISGGAAVNVTQSGVLYGSTALTSFAQGDQVGVQYSTPGNLAPTGLITLVLARL
jgi:hypothetical protein